MYMCLRISKKQLSQIFGFYSRRTGRHYPERLRKHVFTDLVLSELEISEEQYRKTRIFDAGTTRRILQYFSISKDDLHENL